MKALLRKIRQILRDRKTRRIFTRLVSTVAAIVVFVTTYALVLPAITMESEAACGIEAHQHDQSCYTDVLVCEIPESPGHQHDDSCYQKVLTCGKEVHTHSAACYHADTASQAATEAIAVASTESAAAATTGNGLVDNLYDPAENGEPENSLDSSTEDSVVEGDRDASFDNIVLGDNLNPLTDEVSGEKPEEWTSTEAAADATAGIAASTGSVAGVTGSAAATTGSTTGETAATAASTGATDATSTAAGYVPVLDELEFKTLLNRHTGIYYSRLADADPAVDNETDGADAAANTGEIQAPESDTVANADEAQEEAAAENTGEPQEEVTWNRIDKHTELKESDNLRLYLAYTIPAGSLNETNQTASYSLPQNIHLTDEQVDEINATVNGIAGQYVRYDTLEILDQEMYGKYLGIEAVEGTRTPADNLEEYLANNEGQEFISATVKVENVYDEDTGVRKGQDLVFTFAPYTIQKNQHQYDSEGQPTKAGEEVNGWLAIDISTEQIDWEKADGGAQAADIIFVEKDKKSGLKEISTELKLVETAVNGSEDYSTGESDTNGDDEIATDLATKIASDEDKGTSVDKTAKTADKKLTTDNEAGDGGKNKTDPVLIMPAMSFSDSITVLTGRPIAGENDGTIEDSAVANAAISLPEEAEISVRVEADEGTFPAGTTMVLKAVEDLDAVAEAVTETVEKTAAVAADDDSDSDSDTNGGAETKAAEEAEAEKPEKQKKQNTNTNRKPYGFQAVDITFVDIDGNEIEPAKPVRVALTSEIVEQVRQGIQDIEKSENSEEPGNGDGASNGMIADPVVVHVDDNGNAEQMELVVPEDIEPAQGRTEEELLEERKAASDGEESDKAADTDNGNKTDENKTDGDKADIVEQDVNDESSTGTTEDNAKGSTAENGKVVDEDAAGNHDSVNQSSDTDNAASDDSDQNAKSGSTVEFETDSFSVYAIVYTVDFHYEADGVAYEFSLKGGEYVSLKAVLSAVGVAQDDEATEEDELEAFTKEIAEVTFSAPELLSVSKVEEDTTVEAIKKRLGLECEYSAELTEEEIAEINAQTAEAGDWALISLKPFSTNEALTITMTDGQVFTIIVTDTQPKNISNLNELDGKEFALVNVWMPTVVTPTDLGTGSTENFRLKAQQVPSANSLGSDTPTWKFEKVSGTSNMFYISCNGQYLNINQTRQTPVYRPNGDQNLVGDVTLSATPQPLRVTLVNTNDGGKAVCIENSDSFKLDFWNYWYNDPGQGYGAYQTFSTNNANQRFRLVPIFRVEESKPFVIYHEGQNGIIQVLGVDNEIKNCNSLDELDYLPSAYLWVFTKVYDENGDFYYRVSSVSDPQSCISLTGYSWGGYNQPVQKGDNNVIVKAWDNGTDASEGIQFSFNPRSLYETIYLRNAGGADDHFYSWSANLSNSGDAAQTRMYLYEQKPVDAIQFVVKTENPDHGLVRDTGHPGPNNSGQETFETSAVTINDGTEDKYNRYEITALDGGLLGSNNQYKYTFDYWDLGGSQIDAGRTISRETLKIAETGQVLTAHYKRNPAYVPKDEDKQGQFIDKDSLNKWLLDLVNEQMPLDRKACTKTAEVHDYENRIYRVDLTAKSSLSTFAGDINLGYIIDVSSSMKFPSKLTKISGKEQVNLWTINDSWNNKQNTLTQRSTPYYIIADEKGTATVCAIRWDGNNWQWKDASKADSSYANISSNTNNMGDQFHKADSDKYKNGTVTLYQVYNESDNGKTRKDYLEASISGTNETLSDILDILSLARNSNQDPDVLIAWNTFCNQLVDGQGRSRAFTSAKNPIALNYAYDGGTSTDIALLDAAGYRRKDFSNRFSSDERKPDNWWETTTEYNNNVLYHGIDKLGQDGCVYVDMVGKGTQSYETGANAYGFNWDTNSNTPKYAVLITDGAPQRGGKDIDDRFIKDAADLLKARGVTLITVGLSMGNVDKGRVLLYDIATKDASNDPYFYAANSGDELEYVLYSIIRSILQDCFVYGDVTDTVGEAFYPVDKETGKPLVDGDWIQLSGELIPESQRSTWTEPHGVIGKSGDTYTVTWTHQKFGPLDNNKWHGAVFVKAKEDFLGGDVVKTNKGNARIEAKSYTVGEGTNEIQLASQRQDVTVVINGQTVTSHYDPVVDDLPSPRVNVNELDITQNDTSWTVYVRTDVNPRAQIEALYNNIVVNEVVSATDPNLPNQALNADSLRFDVVESQLDTRSAKVGAGEPVTFYMKDVIEMLEDEPDQPTLDWDELIRMAELSDQEQNVGITFRYDLYTTNYDSTVYNQYDSDEDDPTVLSHLNDLDYPGTINIKLVKNHDIKPHKADELGTPAESYTLMVVFSPDYEFVPVGQKGNGLVNYHTGGHRLGLSGQAAGTDTSTNRHSINVIRRMVEIKKTDDAGNILKEAKFKLYRKVFNEDTGDNDEVDVTLVTTVDSVYTVDPLIPTSDTELPGAYWQDHNILYIREVEAPEDYKPYDGEIAVDLQIGDTVTYIVDGTETYPYNWTQTADVAVTGVGDDFSDYVTVTEKEQDILIPGTSQSTGVKETIGVAIAQKNKLGIDIDIIKTDKEDQPLAGASFKLLKGPTLMTKNDYQVVRKGTDGSNPEDCVAVDDNGHFVIPEGGVTLQKLGVGTYTLTEVSAPAGYIITVKPVEFSIAASDDITKRVTFDNPQDNEEGVIKTSENMRQYTIQNEAGTGLVRQSSMSRVSE